MKVKKKKGNGFKPYKISINVRTKTEHDMLLELTSKSITIPEMMVSVDRKNACSKFLNKLRDVISF